MRDRDRKPNPTNPNWVVIPFLDEWDMTKATVLDCLRMRVGGRRPNIMLVSNGSNVTTEDNAASFVQACNELIPDVDVLLTKHPGEGIPLNHAWNIALWQIWEFGGERALVVNNDVELHEDTYEGLRTVLLGEYAFFVTGIGVTPEQFVFAGESIRVHKYPTRDSVLRGGPDFSCFLISRECHQLFPFDPRFTFAGDWDYHHRLVVAGYANKIFGINVPYLHIGQGSQTLKRLRVTAPERAQQIADLADQHRALYTEKWGGTFGQETLLEPKWTVEF